MSEPNFESACVIARRRRVSIRPKAEAPVVRREAPDDVHTDCCYDATVGAEDFCTTDEPCKVDEGDCDSNDECKSHLFCGSNNCPDSLGFSSSVDCCEPKGDKTLLVIMFQPLSIYRVFSYRWWNFGVDRKSSILAK